MEEGEEWDPQRRREQRRDLRRIIDEVQKHREGMSLPDELVQHIQSINAVFRNVVSTREAAIDAEGFQLLSAIGKEQAECSAGELVFDPAIFTEKLVTFMGGRRGDSGSRKLDWAKLGDKVMSCFATPPSLSFLHGALDPAPIVRKQRQKSAGKKDGSEPTTSKPKELTHFENEEESTTKDVAHIFRHLKMACGEGKNHVHYFRFLVDPDSFAHTVENLFHFAFLVKDGRAGIHIDPNDCQPYIHLPQTSGKSVKPVKNQAIISMNMTQWKRAIEKFGISSAQVPEREY